MTTQIPVDVKAAWTLARPVIEERALRIRRVSGLTVPRAVTRVLCRDAALFAVYRRAMLAGMLPEFATQPPRLSEAKQRAWLRIERAARELVATSPTPMTLTGAVARVVRRHPAWYRQYAELRD